ncbi:MAG TPA: hypothetical protein VFS20_03390, partial [Longimicrobium sp.]|nr:hypothetical protein [Longimicrobium sp.]
MSGSDPQQNNVDLYTGEVSFSLPLATLPGPNGMELSVEARYSSAVLETATTWNLARPTGIMGLGWSLPTEAILVDYADGIGSPAYYLAAGGQGGPLACTGTNPDGTLRFLCENLSFWSITYSPAALAWTVVRENGDVAVYGTPALTANAVEWRVAWGDWSGASTVAPGQAPVPLVFHLASISNRFGDRIVFEYDQVLQTVGAGPRTGPAAAFTQACYLRRIHGAAGDVVELNYQEKTYDTTHREYQDPHTTPAPPNAWQDRFETRYLSTVKSYAPDGTLVSTQTLVYTGGDGQTVFLGTGDLSKRVLLSVVSTEAGAGASLAAPGFTYWGMDTADGVSAATPYSATTQALYGALKTATLPAGGTVTYQYTRLPGTTQEPSWLSTRQKTVTPPTQSGVTFSQPLFHLRDRYAVATWLASDTTLRVQAYWWDGRWMAPGQTSQLDTVPLSAASAYATAPVAASEQLFGVYGQNQVHLYAAAPFQPGSWILPSVTSGSTTQSYFTTAFATAEPVTLAAGDTLAAALGLTGGSLCRYRFDGAAWTAEAAVTLAAGDSNACFQCTAQGNWLLGVGTARTLASDPLHLALHWVDAGGAWRSASFAQPRPQARIDSCTIYPGSTFALCALQGASPTGTTVSYVVFWWKPGFSELSAQTLASFDLPAAQVPTPWVGGSFVALGELLYRFDGQTWRRQNVHGTATPLSTRYGVDTVLRTVPSGQQYTCSLRRYDPNTGAWAELQSATAAQGTGVNLAAAGTREVSPWAVLNGALLYQKPDGTVAAAGVTLPALTGNDALSAALPGGRYLVYQSGGNVVVQVLRDGAALSAVTLTGQSVYTSASQLAGAQAFVTYTGTYGAANSTLTLNRVVADAPSGAIAVYPVSAVVANNGYATVSSACLFGAATALARADGWGARFNQATTVAGTTDPTVKTYGWTESYRFNGLAPGETPALAYPVDASYTNAPAFYGLAAGLRYVERTFAAGATTPNSQTTGFWWVYTAALGNAWTGAYARQRQVQAQVDGVATSATSDYSALTGLVTRTDATQWNAQGVQETLTTLFKYFWEVYDLTRALNLLTPVIQTTAQTTVGSTTQTTGVGVVTYRGDWGHGAGQWAPERSYRALSAGAAAFTSWQPGQGDPAGWLRTLTVIARGAGGQPLSSANAFAVPSSYVYGASGLLLTAAFGSADAGGDECGYYGFEGYEDAAGWGWSAPSGSLADYITTADHHTGGLCLLLPPLPGQTVGPVRVWSPASQARTYLFGAWVKTESGFDPAQGAASWQIGVYTTAQPAVQVGTFTLPFGSTGNQWAYLQQTVNLPALRAAASLPANTALVIRVAASNQNAAKNAYVDDLRFSPLDAGFSATVYDSVRRQATANLGTNGETYRVVYDEFNRVVAAVGPGEAVKAVSAESLSRDQGGSGAFLPEFPNSVLGLSTTSASAYYDFHDADATQWTFNGAGGSWAIQGGRLGFSGTSTDPLGSTAVLKVLAFTNFAVRVVCPSHTANAGVGNGDVFVLWNQSAAAWQLVRRNVSGA